MPLRGRPGRHDDGASVGALGANRHLCSLRDDHYPDPEGKLAAVTSIRDLPALPASGAARPPGRAQR